MDAYSEVKWMSRALCFGMDTNEFFPPEIENKKRPQSIPPKIEKICGRCPVQNECLNYAYKHEQIGIWGGTTDYTRTQCAKETNKQRCPGCSGVNLFKEFDGSVICRSCGLSWTSY